MTDGYVYLIFLVIGILMGLLFGGMIFSIQRRMQKNQNILLDVIKKLPKQISDGTYNAILDASEELAKAIKRSIIEELEEKREEP